MSILLLSMSLDLLVMSCLRYECHLDILSDFSCLWVTCCITMTWPSLAAEVGRKDIQEFQVTGAQEVSQLSPFLLDRSLQGVVHHCSLGIYKTKIFKRYSQTFKLVLKIELVIVLLVLILYKLSILILMSRMFPQTGWDSSSAYHKVRIMSKFSI